MRAARASSGNQHLFRPGGRRPGVEGAEAWLLPRLRQPLLSSRDLLPELTPPDPPLTRIQSCWLQTHHKDLTWARPSAETPFPKSPQLPALEVWGKCF